MPNINELLDHINEKNAKSRKKKFTRGNRPDRLIRSPEFDNSFYSEANAVEENPSQSINQKSLSTKKKKHTKAVREKPVHSSKKQVHGISQEVIRGTNDKLDTNGKQLEYRLDTNGAQIENKEETKRVETEYKQVTKQDTELDTKEVINEPIGNVAYLSGQKLELLLYFYSIAKTTGSLDLGPIRYDRISSDLNRSVSNLRIMYFRLIKDGYVRRLPGKQGRSGWIQPRIVKQVFDQLMVENLRTLHQQSPEIFSRDTSKWINKLTTELGIKQDTELGTIPPSSSSVDLNNNLTTTKEEIKELPEEWKSIDISPLKQIKFERYHLEQIYRTGKGDLLTVQNSLDAISHDLEIGICKATSPIALLMKLLRVHGEPYISADPKYETPEEREEREAFERLSAKREIAKERLQQRFNLEFDAWDEKLSPDKRKELAPNFAASGGHAEESALRDYFKTNIFDPEISGNA